MQDAELLQAYAANRSEAAFAELVKRYVDLVYATARRRVGADHPAQEVTQSVFCLLARKAGSLAGQRSLAGWLYRATCFTAAKALRTERRRQQREREAAEMNQNDSTPAHETWSQLSPILDEAMKELPEKDRLAVLLRFFQHKSLREVGETMGTSEAAAKMRVGRAVEQLRKVFAKRGVTCSASTLALLLAEMTAPAASAAIAPSIVAAICSGSAASTAVGLSFVETILLMTSIKTKTLVAAGIALALSTGGFLYYQTAGHPTEVAEASRISTRDASESNTSTSTQPAIVNATSAPASDADQLAVLSSRLRAALREERDPVNRELLNRATIEAIHAFGDRREAAFAVLKEGAKDTNELVYARALSGMYLLGNSVPGMVPYLWEVASEKGPGRYAVTTLSNLGLETRDLPKLIALLPTHTARMVPLIESAFKQNPAAAREFLPNLEQMLDHQNDETRFQAASALARLNAADNPKVLATLATGLNQNYQVTLARSLDAIGRAGPQAKPLLPALMDLANSWNPARYDAMGAPQKEIEYHNQLLRTIASVDPTARDRMPELDQLLRSDEDNRLWEQKLSSGNFTLPELTKALEKPAQSPAAVQQLKTMGPAAADAVPNLLHTLSTTYDAEQKNRIVDAVRAIAPETRIPRVDSKAVLKGVGAAEKLLSEKPREQRNKPLLDGIRIQQNGLINQFTWYTEEQVAALSKYLAEQDPEVHRVFHDEILKADPSLKTVLQPEAKP